MVFFSLHKSLLVLSFALCTSSRAVFVSSSKAPQPPSTTSPNTCTSDSCPGDLTGQGPSKVIDNINTFFTPKDVISEPSKNTQIPPDACSEYAPSGKHGHTYGTKDGVPVSQLEWVRAWVAAGNTMQTAHYGLMILGGEGHTDYKYPPGTFVNKMDAPATLNGPLTTTSGLLQCDTCRQLVIGDNLNICENIWAATRVVLIPQMSPKRQNGLASTGCIIMDGDDKYDTNVCNTDNSQPQCRSRYTPPDGIQPPAANFIGPFCHRSVSGVGWSSANNFPNGYYQNYLTSLTNGLSYTLKNADCAGPTGWGAPPNACTTAATSSGTSTCCKYERTRPQVENIAKKITECAFSKSNPELVKVLDCQNGQLTEFKSIELPDGGAAMDCESCIQQGRANSFLHFTNLSGDAPVVYAANGLCYPANLKVPGSKSCS